MPDQGSAATEHSILQEITAPLSALPDDPVSVAVDADFPVVLRGYDRVAVDAYVQRTSQLVAELQATRSPEAAVRRALERVGEQISGILQRAHQTAEEITAQSRREAEERLERARAEAAEVEAAAHERVRALDHDTDRIWAERQRIVDDARELAQQLVALAETAAARFPAGEAVAEQGSVAEEHPASGGEERLASEGGAEQPPSEEPTMAFEGPFDQEEEVPTEEAEEPGIGEQQPPPGEHRRSVIPPASDAATRRFES